MILAVAWFLTEANGKGHVKSLSSGRMVILIGLSIRMLIKHLSNIFLSINRDAIGAVRNAILGVLLGMLLVIGCHLKI